jgi:hypothetical protein
MIVIGADTHKATHTCAAAGERVVRVPPKLGPEPPRRAQRRQVRSDRCLAVARAALREGPDTLPTARFASDAKFACLAGVAPIPASSGTAATNIAAAA